MTDPTPAQSPPSPRRSPAWWLAFGAVTLTVTVLGVVGLTKLRAPDDPALEATTIVSTTPNEPLFPVRRNLPGGGERLRVILVDSYPGATPQDLEVALIVDFPDQRGQSVVVGAEPLERHGYTFTLVGVREPDTAVLRIIGPDGLPITN